MDPPRHVEDKHAPGALADILQCINPSVRDCYDISGAGNTLLSIDVKAQVPSRMQKTSLSPGAEINVAAVADEAGISRATAYRYFSDSATLALEAVLDGAVVAPENVIPERASTREGVHAVRRYWTLLLQHLGESTARLRRTCPCSQPGSDGAPRDRRAARRLPMFREALAPVGTRLGEKKLEELTLAVSAVSGFENYITMEDIQG